ncbi:type ISP restriction/modification enzyme [Methanobrevibacter sp.]|uniref:type ISP restriction/modification enzyme n=1 Tax=Methanobrevibacter sp. TaxID=66852 RepID=UPI00386667CA
MEKNVYSAIIKKYFNAVRKIYKPNVESSYNPHIITMFNEMGCVAQDFSGERTGTSGENIDIKLWHNEDEVTKTEPFAGVEVKKIGGIDNRALQQIEVEVKRYGNAILTDNLVWRFWQAGDTKMYAEINLLEFKDDKLILKKENVDLFFSILEDFLLKKPAQIKSSHKLAEYMAKHARTIRSIVLGILGEDNNGQPLDNSYQRSLPMFPELYGLYNKIKEDLSPLMNTKEFADMYAQTIVYGLFIARYKDTTLDTFDKFEAMGYLQDESELLKQFFMHIATRKLNPTLESVIDKLCELYKISDVSFLLGGDEHKDTIVHFYEEFLTYYDPELRKSLGVFYTPVQTVHYLIRAVDEILVDELYVDGGLSNNEHITINVPTVSHQSSRKKGVEDIEISVPRIAILDPACGTGSFGAEIIKYVKDKYFSGAKEVFYEEYIQDKNGIISRLIGFEIMMTSYVVAHLKMRRMINSTLGHVPHVQLPINIFLTNTLSPPLSKIERGEQLTLFDFSAAITDEAYHADTWKARRPIKVVIGNPPYLAASTNPYDISAYKTETDGVTDFKEQKHWLNDDYVKFFRFAEQIIDKNDEGILAYVSNNGYLENPTFRGMRGSLLRTFDKIWIVNLHGSANKKETTPEGGKDENIFDIMQGVSLFIGVKKTESTEWANVYYTDLWGTREHKLDALEKGGLEFTKLTIDPKMAYFIPFGSYDKEYYDKGINIAELFPINVTGIVSGKDKVSIAPTREELVRRIDIVKHATNDNEILELWGKFSRGQSAQKIKNDVLSSGEITQISYRPFDSRWTYYSGNSCGWVLWPREKSTMGSLLAKPNSPIGKNIGLVFCKTSREFFSPFVSEKIIASRLFSAQCETTYIAPLYLLSDEEKWKLNINEEAYNHLTQYISEKPSPIEVFDYVYGVLHDPVYAEQYEQYLFRDFPRVPIINDKSIEKEDGAFFVSEDLFKEYIVMGSKLRKLHLMDSKCPVELILEPNTSEDMEIGVIEYKKGALKINKNKQILGISEDVWNYQIGGYKVLDKWFKEHKGDVLTIETFTHIENMVGLLEETIKLKEHMRDLHYL